MKAVKKFLEIIQTKLCRFAAEQNDADAQFRLGTCYYNGIGVEKDVVEAVKWWRKAAEQNNADAQFGLGYCYVYGWGVPKNAVEVVNWYLKAAEQTHANAQFNLGFCYVNGNGVVKDETEGYKWFLLAAMNGSEEAKKFIPVFEKQISAEQIAEGQKLAREFQPH